MPIMTTGQAIVKFLDNQYVSFDGKETKFVEGIFTVFGHGIVCGLGQALDEDPGQLKVFQGKNEQGMAHVATSFAKQNNRRKIIACSSSIGPGAANMITAAGVNRVITMDLHAAQEQGFFDIPVDHMLGQPMLTDYFKLKDLEDLVIVSPDHGSVTRARNMAKPFNVPIAIIDKRRPEPNKSEIMNIIGDVEDKNCVILDDMIDTAGTICNAAKALKDLGARNVYACATHAVLSGPAIERIEASPIKEMVLLNTIPIPEEKRLKKITVLSTGHIFAETMSRVYSNKPISVMFNQ